MTSTENITEINNRRSWSVGGKGTYQTHDKGSLSISIRAGVGQGR